MGAGSSRKVLLGVAAAAVAGIVLFTRRGGASKPLTDKAPEVAKKPSQSDAKPNSVPQASQTAPKPAEPKSTLNAPSTDKAAAPKPEPAKEKSNASEAAKVPPKSTAAEAKSQPTYSSVQLLQAAQATDRSKEGDLGYRSQKCGEGGELVAPTEARGPRPTVFCDLDGTLCDFEAAVATLFKKPFKDIGKSKMWQGIGKARDFYAKLPWTSEGKKLWEELQVVAPVILSGVPTDTGAAASEQKRRWVRQNLGEHVPVLTCFKTDKWRACRPGDILIDDDADHRRRWEERGGLFIHHTGDVSATLAALRNLKMLPPPTNLEPISWVQAKYQNDWWWCKILSADANSTEVEFMEPPCSGEKYKMPHRAGHLRWPRPKK